MRPVRQSLLADCGGVAADLSLNLGRADETNCPTYHRFGKQSGTLKRVPDLRVYLERKTGFEPATLTLARQCFSPSWGFSLR